MLSVCLSAVMASANREAWMIHKSRGVTRSHHHLRRTFSRITCTWIPKRWHTPTPTEMSLWRCWWHKYTQMKGMKYLGRKWQLALSSHMTFLKQIHAHTWMTKDRLSVSVFISLSSPTFYPLQTSSKDTERRQAENRRRQPDIETRWAVAAPMYGFCFQLGDGVLWRSVQLFD